MKVRIFHNPRCGKSRQTLQLLQGRGIDPQVIEYLKTPPTENELEQILGQLGMEPRDLMRRGEKIYKERGLKDPGLSAKDLIRAMAADPILIERPIVFSGGKAALGRPPEAVLAIL